MESINHHLLFVTYKKTFACWSDVKKIPFNLFLKSAAATASAPKPFINQTLAQHAVIGQPFHLNCSAIFDLGVRGDLSWSVPNSKGIDVSG